MPSFSIHKQYIHTHTVHKNSSSDEVTLHPEGLLGTYILQIMECTLIDCNTLNA